MRKNAPLATRTLPLLACVVTHAACTHESNPPAAPPPASATAAPALSSPAPKPGDRALGLLHLEKARAALQAFDRTTAKREFDEALAADPACTPALEELGWFLLDAAVGQDPGAALVCFLDLASLEPTHPSAAAGEGIARAASGDSMGARPLLEAAQTAPDFATRPARLAKIVHALARLDADDGRFEQAVAGFERTLALEPVASARAEPLVELGELYVGRAMLADGEKRLREAIAVDPEHTKARYQLGRLLAKLDRAEESALQLRIHGLLDRILGSDPRAEPIDADRRADLRAELLKLEPECRLFRSNWLRALLVARRYDDATREIVQLSKREPPTPELAFLLARARAGLGDLPGAEKARALMQKLDPKIPRSLDRVILEEWRRGVPSVDDSAIESTLQRWNRS